MNEQEQPPQASVDDVEEQVVQKLKKVITYKKELSAKQKAHLDKIHNQRKGTKIVRQTVEEIGEDDVPHTIRACASKTEEPQPRKPRAKKQIEEVLIIPVGLTTSD
jgi:hypothetical protein